MTCDDELKRRKDRSVIDFSRNHVIIETTPPLQPPLQLPNLSPNSTFRCNLQKLLFIPVLTRKVDQLYIIYFQNDIAVSKPIWASENGLNNLQTEMLRLPQ